MTFSEAELSPRESQQPEEASRSPKPVQSYFIGCEFISVIIRKDKETIKSVPLGQNKSDKDTK